MRTAMVAMSFAELYAQTKGLEADDLAWVAFKSRFDKQYGSTEEEQARYWIFKSNAEFASTHNAKGSTYLMGINDFSDLTPEEFSDSHFGLTRPSVLWPGASKLGTHFAREGEVLPSSVDWSTQGAVTPVKNQQSCGSCWSFSTTGALEGAWEIATGNLVVISEQQFVDCSKKNNACSGGLMDVAFAFAEDASLCTETSYPYEATESYCNPGGCTVAIPKGGVTGFTDVDKTEQALMSAVTQQPVSVAIEADKKAFQAYASGVLQGDCGTHLDHGVLCVGFGTENGVDFWKVKNSWGASWGEEGYVRMLRGKGGFGECGILKMASYPQVDASAPPSPAPAPGPTPGPHPAGKYYEEPPCREDETMMTMPFDTNQFCCPKFDRKAMICPTPAAGKTSFVPIYDDAGNIIEVVCVNTCIIPTDCPMGAVCDMKGNPAANLGICAFPPPCSLDVPAWGERQMIVPGCHGAGCNVHGDQDCAWCVYDLPKCSAAFDADTCEKVLEARQAQNVHCTPPSGASKAGVEVFLGWPLETIV